MQVLLLVKGNFQLILNLEQEPFVAAVPWTSPDLIVHR